MKIKLKNDILNHLKEVVNSIELNRVYLSERTTKEHMKKLIELEESDADNAIELAGKYSSNKKIRSKRVNKFKDELYKRVYKEDEETGDFHPIKYPDFDLDEYVRKVEKTLQAGRSRYGENSERWKMINEEVSKAYKEDLDTYNVIRHLIHPLTQKKWLDEMVENNDRNLKEIETLLEGVKDIREIKVEDLPEDIKGEIGRYFSWY